MKVQLDKIFPLASSPEIAWEFLQNVAAVAGCMPGANITEQIDESHFSGTVKVKLGPATMSFKGKIEVHDIDPAARSLRLVGKGTDSTGSSGATMNLLARIDAAEGGSSALVGSSEVTMSGKAVAFGGRMMDAVADKILRQFGDNFTAQVTALQDEGASADDAGTASPSGGGEINALALGWAVFVDWLRGLFSKKKA